MKHPDLFGKSIPKPNLVHERFDSDKNEINLTFKGIKQDNERIDALAQKYLDNLSKYISDK